VKSLAVQFRDKTKKMEESTWPLDEYEKKEQ
jgi:hypothetical protein